MTHVLLVDADRQEKFATLSGDYNPLHIDVLQARRSQFGARVVHGVHLVLAGLDLLATAMNKPCRVVSLDAQFRSAVLVGEAVWVRSKLTDDGNFRVDIGVGDQTRTTIAVSFVAVQPGVGLVSPLPQPTWPTVAAGHQRIEELTLATGTESLAVDTTLASTLFPSLLGSISHADVAALLAITRVVGMQCPGKWALFRRLTWSSSEVEVPVEQLRWAVANVNDRYSMLKIRFDVGGSEAIAEVIVREPPPTQLSLGTIRQHVEPTLFAGSRALVVGGSRGLGELCAKIMAAGGSEVLLTYNSGAEDAYSVAAEIGADAHVVQLSVGAPSAEAARAVRDFAPTHLLYFATPSISKQPAGSFDPSTYGLLHAVYATGLATVLNLASSGGALHTVFFPSTIFVEERPAGFLEYVAAKFAGEAVCDAWRTLNPAHTVIIDRLPPLVTDQTAAKLGSDTEANLKVLLSALRRMKDHHMDHHRESS